MSTHADRAGAVFETIAAPLWVVVCGVAVAACGGYLLGLGHLLPVAGAAAVLAATLLAYRWPVPVAMVVLLVSGGYSVLAMTPLWNIKATTLGGGVRVEDVFMLGMLAAGLLRASTRSGRRRLGRLLAPFLLLGAWLGLETLRNMGSYGLSAPGELRFFYLLLAVAFCLVASLDHEDRVRVALKGYVLITVALPLVLLPLVLALKGWSFGPSARIFPSHVSLGLLLGLAVLWQGRDFVPWPRGALYLATALGALEILSDAHRSVCLLYTSDTADE